MNLTAKRHFRVIILVLLLGAAVLAMAYATSPASRDFISYWSAGHLLAGHANPYDPASVLQLERAQGYAAPKPLVMRNPPWALFLTIPLGWLSARAGLVLWSATLMGSIALFLRFFRVSAEDRIYAYCFAPVLASLMAGQSSPFLLLGFVLFLRFHRERPLLGGAGLLLLAIKPHLFLIVWPLLLADAIRTRNYRLIVGGVTAVAAATLLAMCFDVHVLTHYISYVRSARIEEEFIPAPAMFLRILVDRSARWIQLVPSCIAMGWAAWFYIRHRQDWDWRRQGMLVMLVAVLVSPYAWMTDEIVLLPPTIAAISSPTRPKRTLAVYALLSGTALMMLIAQVPMTSGAYAWTTIAWLGVYLYATKIPSTTGIDLAG